MDSFEYFDKVKKGFGIKLSVIQKQAICEYDRAILLQATPGAGKTTTLIFKVGHLVYVNGVRPSEILAITFTKSGVEVLHDMYKKFFHTGEIPKFTTIHAIARSVLEEYYKYTGLDFSKVRLIDREKGSASLQSVIKRLYKEVSNEELAEDKVEIILGNIQYIKSNLLSSEDFKRKCFDKEIPFFYEVFDRYELYKEEKSLIDFADMLKLAYKALVTCVDFRNMFVNKYKYILLDEAQDTSKLQFEIIELLLKNKNKYFMIGDEDQNMFTWRGSYVQYFKEFRTKFENPLILNLEDNFRSTKSIVCVANEFIKGNENRVNKTMHCLSEEEGIVKCSRYLDDEEQMQEICLKAKERLLYNEKSVILYRHNVSIYYCAYMLRKCNINFSVKNTPKRMVYNKIIREFLSFINVALDDTDLKSFSNIYKKVYKWLSASNVKKAFNMKGNTLYAKIVATGVKQGVITALNNYKLKIERLIELSPFEVICEIERKFKYDKLEEDYIEGVSKESIVRVVDMLKTISKDFESIVEFRDNLYDLDNYIQEKTKESNNVSLSTIHSVKGLEYDNVFIIDLIDGIFPSKESVRLSLVGETKLLEEERRVCYVAVTRAKKNLFISAIGARGSVPIETSIFFDTMEKLNRNRLRTSSKNFALCPKVTIYDKVHGKGRVIDINVARDLCKVEFDGGYIKLFNITSCIELGRTII